MTILPDDSLRIEIHADDTITEEKLLRRAIADLSNKALTAKVASFVETLSGVRSAVIVLSTKGADLTPRITRKSDQLLH